MTLTLHQLYGSPNNVKVRIALGFLGVEFEAVDADFMDRASVVAASGQPLTPAIVDGDVRLFDSSAILRYLDANHGGERRLFGTNAETVRAIEEWERRTRGGGFGAPVGTLFREFFSPEKDEAAQSAAAREFGEQCREIEAALGAADYLVDGRLTAADCCIAPILVFGAPTETFRERAGGEIGDFIMERLQVPEDCPRTRAYVERVMAFDR